jgi:hypothetical protein
MSEGRRSFWGFGRRKAAETPAPEPFEPAEPVEPEPSA